MNKEEVLTQKCFTRTKFIFEEKTYRVRNSRRGLTRRSNGPLRPYHTADCVEVVCHSQPRVVGGVGVP